MTQTSAKNVVRINENKQLLVESPHTKSQVVGRSNLDANNRQAWYEFGADLEYQFVDLLSRQGIPAEINPQKHGNKYAPDIFVHGVMSDLKTQQNPFFTAGKKLCDPSWTVTFNRKDYVRYKNNYPYLNIYFWVAWEEQERFGVQVSERTGVWLISFRQLRSAIEHGLPEHFYETRKSPDDRNAKSSFLLDLRYMRKIL